MTTEAPETCGICGVLMGDPELHRTWAHTSIDPLMGDAPTVDPGSDDAPTTPSA